MAAGVVHFALPPKEIVKELVRIGKHPYLNHTGLKVVKLKAEEEEDSFRSIITILRLAYNVDFSAYKESTVNRRLSRRMVINQSENMEDYAKLLRSSRAELAALFNDMLIGVTSFFREPEAFDILTKEVFPAILKDKNSKATIRVWVPGCSSGEEVYSLAICLKEYLEKTGIHVNVQFFGTDVSERNIEKSRAGVYPESIADNVSEARLKRFFSRVNHQYQISKTIRDMCVFAKQDLTRDPPFSNLDIVSCRNVLIYFKPSIQKRIIPLFHYALKDGGFLLLGKSESIGTSTELFSPLNKDIAYVKRPVASKAQFGLAIPEPLTPKEFVKTRFTEKPMTQLEHEVERILMNKYAPPGVVVNENMDILIFRGSMAPYISPSPGEADLSLMKMIREELRVELQTAIFLVKRQKTLVKREGIRFKYNGNHKEINIELIPIQTPSKETYFLVLFEDVTPKVIQKDIPKKETVSEENIKDDQITELKRDLGATKETLQTIIEEQEATNEELRSALEEVQSSNEELQSTNEELETAKEELQSTNEELNTLNEELTNRNRELTRSHNDLNNLFSNIDVAIIVLDNNLKIRLFNPISEKLFNLIPADVGRSISDIRLKLDISDLEGKLNDTLENFVLKKEEVQGEKGRWFEMRMRPYLTAEKKIDGLVLSFVDIDELIRKKAELETAHKFAENVLATMREPLVVLDSDMKVIMSNQSFNEMFQAKPEKVLNKVIFEIGYRQWDNEDFKQAITKVLSTGVATDGLIIDNVFPDSGRQIFLLNMRLLPSSETSERTVLITAEDITKIKDGRTTRTLQQEFRKNGQGTNEET